MSRITDDIPPLVQSVVHATDFSLASERAFAHALVVALMRGTGFTILHVREGRRHGDWTAFPAVRETLERWGLLAQGSERAAVFNELGMRVKKVEIPSRFPVLAMLNYLDQ